MCQDFGVCGGKIGACLDFQVSKLEAGVAYLFFDFNIQQLADLLPVCFIFFESYLDLCFGVLLVGLFWN